MRIISKIGFFLAAVFILCGCVKQEEEAGDKREFSLPVQIGRVVYLDVADRIRTVGNVQAEQRLMLNTEVEGQITHFAVEEGQKVKGGDLLARIDPREYELKVAEIQTEQAVAVEELKKAVQGLRPEEKERLQAQVKADESALDLAVKEQDRFRKLFAEGVTAQSVLDEADDRLRQAKESLRESNAALEAAKQSRQEDIAQLKAQAEGIAKRLERAELDLSKVEIRAPFDGVVLLKQSEQGAYVKAGTSILEMIGSSRLKAVLEMPQSYRAKLEKLEGIDFWMKELNLRFKQNPKPGGKVRVIPDADIYSGNVRVQFEFSKPDPSLFPGLTVEAMMNFGVRKNVMHVPSIALVIAEQGTVVYIVKEGQAHQVPVRAFKERNELVEIEDFTHQLGPDADLILRGSGAVFPKAKVFPTNPEPETETPFNAASKQTGKDKKDSDKPET